MKRSLIVIACLITSLLSWSVLAQNNRNSNNASGSFTPSQVKDIQKIISDYLVNNPEILLKASQALQQKELAQSQKDAMAAIKTYSSQIFNDPHTPTAGNQNGTINIVEFFDYQCVHCKAMAPIVESALKNHTNIKLIFKELPIFGGNSKLAAQAALASTKQGKYYAFHNALFAATSPLDQQHIFKIAASVGLDVTQLKQEMKATWVDEQLRANFQLAQKLKLQGTPGFIFSDKNHMKTRFLPGATSQKNFNQQIVQVSATSP